MRATSLLRNQLSFRGCSPEALVGVKVDSVGKLVGDTVDGADEGDAVGAVEGHADPKRVLPEHVVLVMGKPTGTYPHKPMLVHSIRLLRMGRAASSVGTLPIRRLSYSCMLVRRVRAPNSVGRLPDNWLLYIQSFMRLDMSAISVGRVPTSRLLSMSISVRLARAPSSVGREPAKLLESNSMSVRLVRAPSSVGRVPVIRLY
mmetsp:Transcript_16871/g.32323  ORF Transcript_16871/g.32323 Transcript_16871/m.32323 type:complete len:202 (-) Transcript_16871:313-918(-)